MKKPVVTKDPYFGTLRWDRVAALAGVLVLLGALIGGLHLAFMERACVKAYEVTAAFSLCTEWGSRNLCVIGIDDLIRERRAALTLRGPYCAALYTEEV